MIKNTILTEKAIEVINKKLKGKSLTQQDSNYLSRFVRPKLKDILSINAENLLKKLEYNPKALSIERKIKKIMLKEIQDIEAIIVCGSAIQTNYKKYNDIDIIIATKTSQKDNSLKDKINSMSSKNVSVFVDTTYPVINLTKPVDVNQTKKVEFNITISERVDLEYYDLNDSGARWKRLCNDCNEYGTAKNKTVNFKNGEHNLIIRARDEAGNADVKEIMFNVN